MMKSRKEKTTRKRGLTSEEYIDKLNESKPDKKRMERITENSNGNQKV